MPQRSVFSALLVTLWLGVASPTRAEVADFFVGTLDLPAGVENHSSHGIDSIFGTLVSADGTPEISYDLGTNVALETPARQDVVFFRHGVSGGVPWFAAVYRDKPQLLCVNFQREDQGSFWATFTSRAERKRALRLILRYSPRTL